MNYQNPIIPGFYPDPSICRVGEDYYLVNSSFEFFPGVPLFHSKDLVQWEQISYVLTRKSQLPLDSCRTSGGIYAPTLRYHDGRFYMITTNVSDGGNFFVWTDDIRGEWSEPTYIAQRGIDPSLFFDDDGTVYFMSTHSDESGNGCIGQCTLDLATGEMLIPTKPLWYGTGGKCPEGPHMYKIGDYYYLMIAEGGTEYGHMETIARSKSPWGPFESCPRNPILSHRDVNPRQGVFQALGHADLVETQNHKWWMVFHGIRPSQFMLHHTGRETMLAPVTWDETGWPLVNEGNPISACMTVEGPFSQKLSQEFSFSDDFTALAQPLSWSYLRNPDESKYLRSPGALTLLPSHTTLDDLGSPTFLGRRQQSLEAEISTVLEFEPQNDGEEAGLTVFHTKDHHYDLIVCTRQSKKQAFLRRRVSDILVESEPVELCAGKPVYLKIRASRESYEFFAGTEENNLVPVGTGSTQLISTEIMLCTFTGCFTGLFCQGGEGGTKAVFRRYDYKALD